MAKLNSLNKMASAPQVEGEAPDDALLLIEIDGQVYKITVEALRDAVAAL